VRKSKTDQREPAREGTMAVSFTFVGEYHARNGVALGMENEGYASIWEGRA
jgi:hypothetical protein